MHDLIDRQAAIEVIDAVFPVDPMKSEYAQGIACGAALAKAYVEQLPSTQPNSIESSLTQNALDTISILSELRSNYCCFYAVDEPYYHALSEAIRALSTERKGHWISGKCDRCGNHAPYLAMTSTYYQSNYCPNCGADMREGEKE